MLGSRDDATLRRLLARVGMAGRTFVTDDWGGYRRVIPEDQLFTDKDLAPAIKLDNSNIRHYLARFHRRTKVVSKSPAMVGLSLHLHHALENPNFLKSYLMKIQSIFN